MHSDKLYAVKCVKKFILLYYLLISKFFPKLYLVQYFIFLYVPEMPLGQLPVLVYNGIEISQSMTIAQFLAEQFDLAGKTNLEKAQANMAVDTVRDMVAANSQLMHAPAEQKAAIKEKLATKVVPNGLQCLEKLLKANGGNFFAGNAVRLKQDSEKF